MTLPSLPFPINLLPDHSVVTQEGEYLGSWGTDESDAMYEFTPDGAEQYLLESPFRWELCERILSWHQARS